MSSRKSRAQQEFQALSNAFYKDEELRAVRFPRMFKEWKRAKVLGLEKMSLLARLTKKQLLLDAKSVEKINILDKHLDATGRVNATVPNLDHADKEEVWEDDLSEIIDDDQEEEPEEDDGEEQKDVEEVIT